MVQINAAGYSFRYLNEEERTLSDVDFSIKSGEIVLIAGDSGSGKSTLIKSINGLIGEIVEGESSGRIEIGGKDMTDIPIYERSRKIGSVFQNPRSQFFTLNSTSELVFAMENYGLPKQVMTERLEQLKKELPILKLMDREILSLSSGERQLLALASAMALSPDILLFDEPSANLDYGNAMRLKKIIKKLSASGKTVIIADHRFFYLDGIIDRALLVQGGRIREFASETEFRESDYNTRDFELFNLDIPTRNKALMPKETFAEKTDSLKCKTERQCGEGDEAAQLVNVSKWEVLKDLSISFRKGEICLIVGANGAGKTTLARLLTGSLKPDRGKALIGKLPFYVMQDADFQLFGTSVINELKIGNKNLSAEKAKKILRELDLWRLKDAHPFDLSGGEKQRLQIALAAVSDTELVIFDEPTSGLDIKSMRRVVEQIQRLAENKAVIVISHDYEFIRRAADRIIYLKNREVCSDFILRTETIEILNEIFIQMEENENEKRSET